MYASGYFLPSLREDVSEKNNAESPARIAVMSYLSYPPNQTSVCPDYSSAGTFLLKLFSLPSRVIWAKDRVLYEKEVPTGGINTSSTIGGGGNIEAGASTDRGSTPLRDLTMNRDPSIGTYHRGETDAAHPTTPPVKVEKDEKSEISQQGLHND